jgi:hypothetical protein
MLTDRDVLNMGKSAESGEKVNDGAHSTRRRATRTGVPNGSEAK